MYQDVCSTTTKGVSQQASAAGVPGSNVGGSSKEHASAGAHDEQGHGAGAKKEEVIMSLESKKSATDTAEKGMVVDPKVRKITKARADKSLNDELAKQVNSSEK